MTREKNLGDRDLLSRTHQLSTGTEGKRGIQRHAHHGVRAFPSLHDNIKDAVLVPRQSSDPIVGHATSGMRARLAPRYHTVPKITGQYITFRCDFLTLFEWSRYTACDSLERTYGV